ncbi:MAG TPA: FAD-binding protein [Chitinophagales bacterium]|nr:FAD-binding protein [Chitinophagales bacterium]
MTKRPHIETLTTYALNANKPCTVYKPASQQELSNILSGLYSKGEPVSIIGGRNSFGDVFFPAGHTAIDVSDMPTGITINNNTATAMVDCGVKAIDLADKLQQSGYYLPAQSGSYLNTPGGDISANVNGKDSWKHGNFYHQVNSLTIMLASGNTVTVDKSSPELFNTITGGLGMGGIILSAVLQLKKQPANALLCQTIASNNLDETIHTLKNLQPATTDFAYAWVDALAKGKTLGRAIVETATFATTHGQVITHKPGLLSKSDDWFWKMIRTGRQVAHVTRTDKQLLSCFNYLRYQYLKANNHRPVYKDYITYQYPISNILPNWNKQFAPRGMQEVHCLFGFEKFEQAFLQLVNVCNKHGIYPELCAIRRHIPDNGYLSFSGDGLSVTINYDRNGRGDEQLYKLERELAATVIKNEGKIYLAKFPYLLADEVAAMYPYFAQFKKVKQQIDPAGFFKTTIWNRLNNTSL